MPDESNFSAIAQALRQAKEPSKIELINALHQAIQLDNHFYRPVGGSADAASNVFSDEQFEKISARYFELLTKE